MAHLCRRLFSVTQMLPVIAWLIALCLLPFGTALNTEGLALLDFKRDVLDPGRILQSWNETDSSPCKWRGVVCNNVSSKVTILNLPRARLSGTISPQLGTLSELRRLGLHINNLTGPIPASVGNLTKLRALYLQSNSLNSTLPDGLGLLPNLLILDLSNNKLEGAIPDSYRDMLNLQYMNLSNNQLSGRVPDGSLSKFPASSFAGNLGLCGSSVLGLPPCSQQKTGYHWSVWKILLLSVGSFLFVKIVIALFLLNRWLQDDKNREINLGKGGKLVMFKGGQTVPTSREMLRAVRKIRKEDIVGEGGYGVVYKMALKGQRLFAVKKLKKCLESARGFENELETLGEIKHCNLVKLRGYCIAPSSKLLIYDFISNGTLDQLLHPRIEEEKRNLVDWEIRVKVALGVARALAYIHHSCEPRIVHLDVSSTNVLLDEDFEPHLADFGLARLLDDHHTHITVSVAGTFGYVAPEYARVGQATEKSDVYSYGVILLELLSGRRPTDTSFSEEHVNLSGWVRDLRNKSMEFEIVDKSLRDTVAHRELAIMLEIACTCIALESDERPRMDKVVQYIERLADFDTTPSTFTLSTVPSINYRHDESMDFCDFPGFRSHDGDNFILDIEPGI